MSSFMFHKAGPECQTRRRPPRSRVSLTPSFTSPGFLRLRRSSEVTVTWGSLWFAKREAEMKVTVRGKRRPGGALDTRYILHKGALLICYFSVGRCEGEVKVPLLFLDRVTSMDVRKNSLKHRNFKMKKPPAWKNNYNQWIHSLFYWFVESFIEQSPSNKVKSTNWRAATVNISSIIAQNNETWISLRGLYIRGKS